MKIDARSCDTVRDFRMIQRVFADLDTPITSATISENLWKAYSDNFKVGKVRAMEIELAVTGKILLDGIACSVDLKKQCPSCHGSGMVLRKQ